MIKILFKKFTILFTKIISTDRSSFAFFICLLLIVLNYRVQLIIGLFKNPLRPFDFNPKSYAPGWIFSHIPKDLLIILGLSFIFWLISKSLTLLKNKQWPLISKIFGIIILNITLIILSVIHVAHTQLLFSAQSGLDHSMIMEVFLNVSSEELMKFCGIRELLFLLIPLGLFWFIWLLPLWLRIKMVKASIFFIIILSICFISFPNEGEHQIPKEIDENPVTFLISDLIENIFFNPSIKGDSKKIGNKDRLSISPKEEMFFHPVKPLKFLSIKTQHQWNIIFLIMESVGSRYIFDKSNKRMPMPFLHNLSKEAWYLKRHFTTSNISTKAIFSLMSGLYDLFKQDTFGLRSDARVPSLINFLSKSHESFLVTPSPINWYFPLAFVKNSGLREMYHFENLNLKMKEELHSFGHYIGRDEIQTVDFFIQRLKRAKEPFLAIYISFLAHLPYFDYGPDYRIMEEDNRAITRYYNNLYLLDNMIRRIYEHLKQNGQLERTIFVIVGDHGQAFGQHHPDNYMHHRYSYNENLQTPAFIYQPIIFKPKTFEIPTTHVDILPTILDAMRIPYDPLLFDGESLFNHRLRRRYIFFYGYEKTISSLDTQNLIKVQYSLKKRRGWAFDLRVDPDEKSPLDIQPFSNQMEALLKFVNHHEWALVKYNEGLNLWKDKRPPS